MADSPKRMRTPWLLEESAGATEDPDTHDFGGGEVGGPRGGVLQKMFCRGICALGVVAIACLAATHQVSKALDGTEYELIFEGEVPQGGTFTLHVGSVCFGATPFPGPASKSPPLGAVKLEVKASRGRRAIHGEKLLPDVQDLQEREPAWKAVNALNRSDLQGLEFYDFRVPELDQKSGSRLAMLDGVDLLERTGRFIPWGETVRGALTYHGKWLSVIGRGFLPTEVDGVLALQRQMEAFVVDSRLLRSKGPGLFFHHSLSGEDHDVSGLVRWGEVVHGYPAPTGRFLMVPGRGFLPMEVYGVPTIRRVHVAVTTLDGDWLTSNGTMVRIEGDTITRPGRSPGETWTWTLEQQGNGTYCATFEETPLSAELVQDDLTWSDQDVWVKLAAASPGMVLDFGGAQGEMAWLLFDDQEAHWGRAARMFNASAVVLDMYKAANMVSSFLPPPRPNEDSVTREFQIREGFAHHWHIALVGVGVGNEGNPRYRVWAKSQLSSGAPGEFNPEKCPLQPTVTMQRKARQVLEYVQV